MTPTEAIKRFDDWFEKEYNRLHEKLSLSVFFDEDAFHDAYLSVRGQFKDSLSIIPNFAALFASAYRRINKQHISEQYDIFRPEDWLFEKVADDTPDPFSQPEGKTDRSRLVCLIKQYVKRNYNHGAVLIWESRNIADMSLCDISQVSDCSIRRVKNCIDTINNDVRQHFAKAVC